MVCRVQTTFTRSKTVDGIQYVFTEVKQIERDGKVQRSFECEWAEWIMKREGIR
jgi:hypothetical protein